jgi:hypothetical protein
MIEYDKYDTCPWKPIFEEEYLNELLKKKFRPIKYNQFRWWRQWKQKGKDLPKQSRIDDKILNGDYDELSYKYEVQLIEHRLRKRWFQYYNDHEQYLEKSSVDIARRKKLMEDLDKSETNILHSLYKDISDICSISIYDVQHELLESKGKTLYTVYKKIKSKYCKI